MNNTSIQRQRVAVYGFILNTKQELLLVKRSHTDSSPGIWEMPGGGLELDENPQEGAKREIKEETNLDVTVHYPVSIFSGFSKRTPSIQVIRIAYFCALTTGSEDIRLSSEHSAFTWKNPHHLDLSPLSDFLQQTISMIKTYPQLLSHR